MEFDCYICVGTLGTAPVHMTSLFQQFLPLDGLYDVYFRLKMFLDVLLFVRSVDVHIQMVIQWCDHVVRQVVLQTTEAIHLHELGVISGRSQSIKGRKSIIMVTT